MKQKKDNFYYKNLVTCVECSYKAANFLKNAVRDYDHSALEKNLEEMHAMEQEADTQKHKMTSALMQAFITPIEREDLVALSSYLDDITDALDEVLMEFYICDIREIREDVLPFIDLLPECVSALHDVLKELKHFKTSKTIEDYIIKVNDLEEQGDKLYRICLHQLYQEEDVRTIIIWRNIYEGIEKCLPRGPAPSRRAFSRTGSNMWMS